MRFAAPGGPESCLKKAVNREHWKALSFSPHHVLPHPVMHLEKILAVFWYFWAHVGSLLVNFGAIWAPFLDAQGSKMESKGPKMSPRELQSLPKWSQDCPKGPPSEPWEPPKAHLDTFWCPTWAQSASKTSPDYHF